MIGGVGVGGVEFDVLGLHEVKSEEVWISAVDLPLSSTRYLNASMNVRLLEVPAKYESAPPSSRRYGDCCTLNSSSL